MSNTLVEENGAAPEIEVKETEIEKTEAPTEEPEGEGKATEEGEGKKPELSEVERVKRATQRRIDRLVRERAEEKAKAEYYERLLQERNQPAQKLDKQQFANEEDFLEAEVARRLQQIEAQKAENQELQKALEREAKRERLLLDAELSGEFDRQKFAETVPVTQDMADAVMESDIGDKLVLHLYANPDEAERIASLPRTRQIAEIGKLEVLLSEREKPTPSRAPAPPKTVTGAGKSGSSTYKEGMSLAEYARFRGRKI